MRHLVTGGSGFLGNLIARRLDERGESVRVLDLWEDSTRPRSIEFVRCDIRDRAGVAAALQDVEVVHHNVALVPLTKSGRNFREVNVEGSRLIAEEAVKAGVRSFIHMSSSAVFGLSGKRAISPTTPPAPVEDYGRAKLAGEQAVREICARAALPLVVIRPKTILGAGRLGIFQLLFDWISEGRSVYVIGRGDNLFQFVHANDLMDAYLLALDHGKPGTYNVGTNRYGTMRQALENLVAFAGTDSRVRSLPVGPTIGILRLFDRLGLSPLAPWHYLTYHRSFHCDTQPLLDLGWAPRYSNDEMLRESYDWRVRNREKPALLQAGSVHRRPVKERLLWVLRHLS